MCLRHFVSKFNAFRRLDVHVVITSPRRRTVGRGTEVRWRRIGVYVMAYVDLTRGAVVLGPRGPPTVSYRRPRVKEETHGVLRPYWH